MSQLIDFYRGDGTDTEGRHLDDILSWSNADLEEVHDYIQWLFPLVTPSNFNPDAPLLTRKDIAIFRADPDLRERLRLAYLRVLNFLGLAETEQGQIVDGPNLVERSREVWRTLTTTGCASLGC